MPLFDRALKVGSRLSWAKTCRSQMSQVAANLRRTHRTSGPRVRSLSGARRGDWSLPSLPQPPAASLKAPTQAPASRHSPPLTSKAEGPAFYGYRDSRREELGLPAIRGWIVEGGLVCSSPLPFPFPFPSPTLPCSRTQRGRGWGENFLRFFSASIAAFGEMDGGWVLGSVYRQKPGCNPWGNRTALHSSHLSPR